MFFNTYSEIHSEMEYANFLGAASYEQIIQIMVKHGYATQAQQLDFVNHTLNNYYSALNEHLKNPSLGKRSRYLNVYARNIGFWSQMRFFLSGNID